MVSSKKIDLNEDNLERYSRHVKLKEIGVSGQKKLGSARVLVVGAGGLGSPVIQYLSAAGIGKIGIIDDDKVELSNLQRQILYKTKDIGKKKVEIAHNISKSINPNIKIYSYPNRLEKKNIRDVVSEYDFIADGSDNFETRFLINDICFFEKKILVSAAVTQFDGHISTFKPQDGGPCYRCLHPSQSDDDVWNCENMGILGSLAGTIGSLQASEIIKEILGIGRSLSGWLLIYDGLETTFREVKLLPDPQCPLCSNNASIKNYFV
ncbi:MAG: adenylyltransferase [Alphaproteobacteria bacterium TMED87]|nr:adenylyltransferase [Rhodospirillaceae bacterium]OUV08203.1 MAG: adenylyltransferase [Alphaproteobacteria bacterium TMED87]|tara:strand:+ start:122 stop:916 length:795 start_codon:yes stop_codon:yes gene_type:complete